MPLSRYKELEVIRNVDEDYKIVFSSRFPYNGITQYNTENLKYPSLEQIVNMKIAEERWGYGSRLYKYAYQYYGDSSYWWVIAWFNKIGTENDINYGNKIRIPQPLDYVLITYGL
jgi:hypothetical protein